MSSAWGKSINETTQKGSVSPYAMAMGNGTHGHHYTAQLNNTTSATNVTTKRVYLWTIPRSISTAFERCFIGFDNIRVVHEPYSTAYYFGPDSRRRNLAPFVPTEREYSYQNIKDRLEDEYEGKDFIFCKDHAFTLDERYDMMARGFAHTILIRDPVKTMSSFYRLARKPKLLSWPINTILPSGYAYKELYDLHEHVRTKLGQDVIIIDADDLLRYPEQMVRRYCDAIGVPFQSEMMDWNPRINVTQSWSRTLKLLQFLGGIYDRALTSTCFQEQPHNGGHADNNNSNGAANSCNGNSVADLASLPDEVLEAVKVSQPYYNKLYDRRLVPEDRETEV